MMSKALEQLVFEASETPEMTILIGIPASGKSTFQQQYFPEREVISLDLLGTRHKEELLLRQVLAARKNCVIDNTNVTRSERAKFITAGRNAGYRITGYYFQSKISDCLERNARRTGKKCIPRAGVIGRAKCLELPEQAEGFDLLKYVVMENNGFTISDWKEEANGNQDVGK